MKKFTLQITIALVLLAGVLRAQNVTVAGAVVGNGSYPTLGGAFSAINASAQTGANIVVSIVGNTTEASTAVLNSGTWTSLSISPAGGGARTVSGNIAGPLINFDGADRVVMDGLNTGGNSLLIENTNVGAVSTIQFINDARIHGIQNLTLRGATTSTTPATSTTVEEPTTTTSTSSSTISTSTTILPSTTTTTQIDTTTSTTNTTTPPTTTTAPDPTTTQAPYTRPQTTTTSAPVAESVPDTTTTTVLPEPETTTSTTILETSTTDPSLPLPNTTDLTSSVPPLTLPDETSVPTSEPTQETDIPQTTTPTTEISSTTTLLDIEPEQPITDEKVAEVLDELKDASPAQVVAAIEQILTTALSSDQAVSIASSPEVLAAITQDQAQQIFEELVVEEITVEQADELVAVLNEAPTKVKKAFQDTINVFAGVFDSFQMVGQTIPVGQRRTLVAVSNTLVAVGAGLRRREN